MSGLRRAKSMFGGMDWFCMDSEALRMPAIPAAPSVCPITVLMDPT